MESVNLDELSRARDAFLRLLAIAHATNGRSITYTAECRVVDGTLVIDKDDAVVYETRDVQTLLSR